MPSQHLITPWHWLQVPLDRLDPNKRSFDAALTHVWYDTAMSGKQLVATPYPCISAHRVVLNMVQERVPLIFAVDHCEVSVNAQFWYVVVSRGPPDSVLMTTPAGWMWC